MSRSRDIQVVCRISRSGFSGERVFRVSRSDGGEHIGVAPVHYFRTPSNKPIGPDVPPAKGEQVEGLIQALLIGDEEGQASVVFPGGEMARVDMDQVRSLSPEAISHVPI